MIKKHPTQVDVAQLAGVSRATVSYIINGRADHDVTISDDTKQRVLAAIQELGYQPDLRARALRSGGTNTLGLLIPDMHNPHYWAIANSIEEEANQAGYSLLISSTSLSPKREIQALQAFFGRRIDGHIIFVTFAAESDEILKQLADSHSPVVVFGATSLELDNILSTYSEATTQMMDHLIELGHCHIGFVYGTATPALAINRLKFYNDALLKADLPVIESLIDYCGTNIEDGYQAAERLLRHEPQPTAILVVNDLLAMGVLRAAADNGLRVPDDLSVASFDDIEMAAYQSPPLTTVHSNEKELGRTAVRLVLERINEPDRPLQKIVIPTELVIRSSTAPRS